jgi:hypothetical protein
VKRPRRGYRGHLRRPAFSLAMAKKVRGDDGENAALPPLSRVLRGLARRGVVEAFVPNIGNGPVLRIRVSLMRLDARRLRRSPTWRSFTKGHVRNSRNAGLYRNPGVRASRPRAPATTRSLSPGGIRQAWCGIFNGLCASCPITKDLCAENGRSRAEATAALR